MQQSLLLKIHPLEIWSASMTMSYLKASKLKGPGCFSLFCFSGRERSFIFSQYLYVKVWSRKDNLWLESICNCPEGKGNFAAKEILNQVCLFYKFILKKRNDSQSASFHGCRRADTLFRDIAAEFPFFCLTHSFPTTPTPNGGHGGTGQLQHQFGC